MGKKCRFADNVRDYSARGVFESNLEGFGCFNSRNYFQTIRSFAKAIVKSFA